MIIKHRWGWFDKFIEILYNSFDFDSIKRGSYMYEIKMFSDLNDDLISIRREVFMEEQNVSLEDEFEGDDDKFVHFGIYNGDCIIGYVRAMTDMDIVYIGRVVVKKSYRRSGIGRMLMSAAEEYGETMGCKTAHLRAQTQACGFYEKSGYSAYGETFFEVDIEHIAMKKQLV